MVKTLAGDTLVAQWDETEKEVETLAEMIVRLNAPGAGSGVGVGVGAVVGADVGARGESGVGGTGGGGGHTPKLYVEEIQLMGHDGAGAAEDVSRLPAHTYLQQQLQAVVWCARIIEHASVLENAWDTRLMARSLKPETFSFLQTPCELCHTTLKESKLEVL